MDELSVCGLPTRLTARFVSLVGALRCVPALLVFRVTGVLVATTGLPLASSVAEQGVEVADQMERVEPMPEVAEKRLNRVLQRYYEDALGGEEVWRKLVSLRVDGSITTPDGAFALRAYQKKPNMLKMSLKRGDIRIVLGYDGDVAWKQQPGDPREAAVPMGESEARRFVHNAQFDPFLLYPTAPGKDIVYDGLVENGDGVSLHVVRVTLDSGYEMEYHLDLTSFLVQKVVSRDLSSGSVSVIEYFDYQRVLGTPVARRVVNSLDGTFSSEFQVDRVEANLGMARWMFKFPGQVELP